VSGFLQDRVTLLDSLRLTVGTKLERNEFSGVEVQPSARLAWAPAAAHSVWGAVSRAVRVPTRLERDVAIDAADPAAPVLPRLLGNRDFESERMLAYELGYRWRASEAVFVDLAGFYNRYRGLSSLELGEPFADPVTGQTIVPIINQNLTDGVAKGGEAQVTWSPVSSWRLSASYSNVVMTLEARGQDLNRGLFLEGSTPRHQLGLQSFLDLPAHFQLDAFVRYAARIRSYPDSITGEGLPSEYVTLDLRASWQGLEPLELSVVGQNLLQAHHAEFPTGTEVERGVYFKLAARL
jgi:iron complex outermembrane receptor protein